MPEQGCMLRGVNELRHAPKTPAALAVSGSRSLMGISRGAVLTAVGLGALYFAFRDVDVFVATTLLTGMGGALPLAFLPVLAALLVETLAWRMTFGVLGTLPRFSALFRVRWITESFCLALPMGPLVSEAIKPHLLARECGLSFPVGVTGVLARKYMLCCAQGFYLVVGFVLGFGVLTRCSVELLGRPEPAAVVLLVALSMMLGAELAARLFAGGTTARSVMQGLTRLPSARLRSALLRFREQGAETDGHAARFFGPNRTRAVVVALCLGAWLLEATETWVMLQLLGVDVAWGDAVAVEAVVISMRHLLFMVPFGLGTQELGYAVLLASVGVHVDVAGAFVILKRVRELVIVLVGYVLFIASKRDDARRIDCHPSVAPDAA